MFTTCLWANLLDCTEVTNLTFSHTSYHETGHLTKLLHNLYLNNSILHKSRQPVPIVFTLSYTAFSSSVIAKVRRPVFTVKNCSQLSALSEFCFARFPQQIKKCVNWSIGNYILEFCVFIPKGCLKAVLAHSNFGVISVMLKDIFKYANVFCDSNPVTTSVNWASMYSRSN